MTYKGTKDFIKDVLELAGGEFLGISSADDSYVNRSEVHSEGESGSRLREVPTDLSFSDLPSATVFIKKKQWANFSEHWYYDVPYSSQSSANKDLIDALSILICTKLTNLAKHEAFTKVKRELSSMEQLTKAAQTQRVSIDEKERGVFWTKVNDIVTNMFKLLSPETIEEDSLFSCWYTVEGLDIGKLRDAKEELIEAKEKLQKSKELVESETIEDPTLVSFYEQKVKQKQTELGEKTNDQFEGTSNVIARKIASEITEDKMAFNGVIELANVATINTSTSLYGKGSATLDIAAPEDILYITEIDIYKAYSELVANAVPENKDLIRTWIKSKTGPIVRANESKRDSSVIYINTITGAVFKEPRSGKNPLPITDSEKKIIDSVYRDEVPYVLQTMKENFQGKAIIEPRDQVYIWASTPSGNPQIEKSSEFDKKVSTEALGEGKVSRDQISQIFIESLNQAQRNPYNDLAKLHEIIDRNNGEIQIFQGVVQTVKGTYTAESGEHRLVLSCVDNMDWLSLATQIEIPGLRDPRLKVNWPVVAQENSPLAWKSSKIVMEVDNAAFDSVLGFENQKITIRDPATKESKVVDLSKKGIAPPILFEKLFAGVDAANVICTLVTGFPFDEDILTRTAADVYNYKMDPTGRAIDDNFKRLVTDISRDFNLEKDASIQALRDPIFETIKHQARVQNRFLGDFVPVIDLSFISNQELKRNTIEKKMDRFIAEDLLTEVNHKKQIARVEQIIQDVSKVRLNFADIGPLVVDKEGFEILIDDKEMVANMRSWLILNDWQLYQKDTLIYTKSQNRIADRFFTTLKNRYGLKQSLKSEVLVFGLPLYINDLDNEIKQINSSISKLGRREKYRKSVYEGLAKDDRFLKEAFARIHDLKGNLKYHKEKMNIRRNVDRNFLMISPRYKDSQVEAYNRMLTATDFPLWQTDYTTVERTCKEVAQTIDFEFYADPQGNLNFTPPRYNRTPIDLLTLNMLTPSREYFFEEVFFGGLIDIVERIEEKKSDRIIFVDNLASATARTEQITQDVKVLGIELSQIDSEIEKLEEMKEDKILENTLLNYIINPVFVYKIEDYDIIGWDLQEGEPDYTRIDVSGAPDYTDLSQAIETFYMAFGVHYQLWRTYGYKFASIHKKFIHHGEQARRYGEILLAMQEGKVFSGNIIKRGDSKHQPGDVGYISSRDMLYYITGVQHNFTYGKGYTTSLTLQYGRRPGTYIPHPFDSLGSYILNADSNEDATDQKIRKAAREKYYWVMIDLGVVVRDIVFNEADSRADKILTIKKGASFFIENTAEKKIILETLLKYTDDTDTSTLMLRSGFEGLTIEIKARLNRYEDHKENNITARLKDLMRERQALVRTYLEKVIDKNDIKNGRIEIVDSNDFEFFRISKGDPGSTLKLSWLPIVK